MNFNVFQIKLGVPRIYPYPNGLKLKLTWPHVTCGYLDLIYSLFQRLFSEDKRVGTFFSLFKEPEIDSRLRINLLLLFDIKGYAIVKE